MLENLINLVKEQAGTAIVDNPAIPNDRNDEAIATAGSSITGSLQQMLANGNMKDVLQLFNGQSTTEAPAAQNISGDLTRNFMEKFGLNQQVAGSITSGILPGILGKLVNRTNDPSDSSFDLQSIFNSLSNGQTSGINVQDIFAKFKGSLDKDGDGDVDLQDLTAMFSGNKSGGGGGILDTVKGLFN
ncbi:MAG: hypothetical protein QM731_22810 [Chitinophagaceae bacterium]